MKFGCRHQSHSKQPFSLLIYFKVLIIICDIYGEFHYKNRFPVIALSVLQNANETFLKRCYFEVQS